MYFKKFAKKIIDATENCLEDKSFLDNVKIGVLDYCKKVGGSGNVNRRDLAKLYIVIMTISIHSFTFPDNKQERDFFDVIQVLNIICDRIDLIEKLYKSYAYVIKSLKNKNNLPNCNFTTIDRETFANLIIDMRKQRQKDIVI